MSDFETVSIPATEDVINTNLLDATPYVINGYENDAPSYNWTKNWMLGGQVAASKFMPL